MTSKTNELALIAIIKKRQTASCQLINNTYNKSVKSNHPSNP